MAHRCAEVAIFDSSKKAAVAAHGALFRVFEQVDPRPVRRGNLRDRRVASDLLSMKVNQRVPKSGPADSEADETRNACGSAQPLSHLLVVLAAAQNDAAHLVAAGAARRRDDLLAIVFAFDALNLPDVWLDTQIL